MILVDKQILKKVSSGTLGIEPFRVDRVQPNSYDVSLSQNFIYIGRDCNDVLDVKDKNTYDLGAVSVRRCSIILTPGEFVLGETSEKVQLPDNIVASIEGKSSLARLGLQIHQTGGWIHWNYTTQVRDLSNSMQECRSVSWYSSKPSTVLSLTAGCLTQNIINRQVQLHLNTTRTSNDGRRSYPRRMYSP